MVLSRTILALIVFLGLFCYQQTIGLYSATEVTDIRIPYEQDSTHIHQMWKRARNNGNATLEQLYTSDAIKVVSPDSICEGQDAIKTFHLQQSVVTNISSLFSTEVNPARGITYEILNYEMEDSKSISQLVIYEKGTEHQLRAFEYEVYRQIQVKVDTSKITMRRKQWMEYCNTHKVAELVYDLYSPNTLYYNHRPLVKGSQALVREYGYMNSESYSLALHPLIVHVVNDSTVFEIGQCKGSYNGKYILIWKKEEDGQWRIFIDSNV